MGHYEQRHLPPLEHMTRQAEWAEKQQEADKRALLEGEFGTYGLSGDEESELKKLIDRTRKRSKYRADFSGYRVSDEEIDAFMLLDK